MPSRLSYDRRRQRPVQVEILQLGAYVGEVAELERVFRILGARRQPARYY